MNNRRSFLQMSFSSAVATSLISPAFASANEMIGLGFIGCGGRANELMSAFDKVENTKVVALCDPDPAAIARSAKRFPEAETYADLRELLENKSVDVVVIAACNHWHCLAAVWAMQAGKDVYVEKPLSHSQWEGEQVVAAARKYDRICQVGTQQRSDPMQAEIKSFLHDEKLLGAIQSVRVNRYGVRASIGKRETPLVVDPTINYDLWLGPAADQPIFRDKLHYDWHWNFNTGSGEMGNWGVHVLDDVRNVVFCDSVAVPQKIMGAGGRVVWNDAGETPNVHFVYLDTGSYPVVIGLANIMNSPMIEGDKITKPKAAAHPGPDSGYIVYCDGGRYEGSRGQGTAYDRNGKLIKKFKGNSGMPNHQQNFIDAVRSRKRSSLNAEVQIGHDSSGWCNLANIAYQAGQAYSADQVAKITDKNWSELVEATAQLLSRHALKLDASTMKSSSLLTIDPKSQRFVGVDADLANSFIKRTYRRGFEVPNFTG
jgi:predicted dehydrogenase